MSTNNVFGSGNVVECAEAMLAFVAREVAITLPRPQEWRCTRMDVTQNYDVGSLANVRSALMALRHAEGGRYQLRTEAESVYWSLRSQVRSGKAYAKGPHMAYARKKGMCEIADDQLALCSRILRLELSLRSQFWREYAAKPWHQHSEADLDALHERYFAPLVGKAEIVEMGDVRDRVVGAAERLGLSPGRANAAYLYWCSILDLGFEAARELTPKATHHRHVKLLREAGLSYADFQARDVVPLRREPLILSQPVRSWDDLRRAA